MWDSRETLIVWNPSAGSTDRVEQIKASLQNSSQSQFLVTESRQDCIEQVKQACVGGIEAVIACGGDGTVNSVLEGIMRSEQDPVMGILPLGTGNDFSRSLGFQMDPSVALEQLRSGEARRVDVIHYSSSDHEGWYLNMLTGGNTGIYMDHLTDEIKRRWGPLSYLRGVIERVQDLQVFQIEVSLDDQPPQTFTALNVFLANGRMSGGGMSVCPEAQYDDGAIDLIVIQDGLPVEIASLSTEYFVADYLSHDLVTHLKARSVVIEADPPLPLTADGDRIGETSLRADVLPRAISMLIPADTRSDAHVVK